MFKMHKPPHPGMTLKELYMEPLGITITSLANHLSVDRKTVSRLINGKTSLNVEMALRLSKAFDTTPELWLNLQNQYDLWSSEKTLRLPRIPTLVPPSELNSYA